MNEPSSTAAPTAASYDTVILPTDGSAEALGPLPTAQALSARFGARLQIVSVAVSADEARTVRDHLEHALDGVAGDLTVEVIVGDDPAQAIVDRAGSSAGSLVCMSTRGRGRIAGAFIGSVARSVVQRSRSPLVLLGPQADRPGWLVGPSRRRPANWPEPLSTGEIVACVDGSAESERAVAEAGRWATALGLPVAVLTVAEETVTDVRGVRPNRFGPAEPQRYVDALAGQQPESVGVVVYDRIGVVSGMRARLAAQPAALVVLSAHARTGFERLRHGAISAEIVAISTAPVLVIPVEP
jgi:nucleotide-binding universal stress UspA family protein